MALHAKFVVTTVELKHIGLPDDEGYVYPKGAIVTLRPIELDGENKDVDGTPHGELRFGTLDEKASKRFEAGQVYSMTLIGVHELSEVAEAITLLTPPVVEKVPAPKPAPKPKAAPKPRAIGPFPEAKPVVTHTTPSPHRK